MYNDKADFRQRKYGGVTQLVEYPVHTRYVTCSNQVAATRPVGQAVKTPPFHGGNMGSIPVRVTKQKATPIGVAYLFAVRESKDVNAAVRRTVANLYFLQSRKSKRFSAGHQKENHPYWGGFLFAFYGVCSKYSSAWWAAMAPSATAVTTCRKTLVRTSPAANTPGRFVFVDSSAMI